MKSLFLLGCVICSNLSVPLDFHLKEIEEPEVSSRPDLVSVRRIASSVNTLGRNSIKSGKSNGGSDVVTDFDPTSKLVKLGCAKQSSGEIKLINPKCLESSFGSVTINKVHHDGGVDLAIGFDAYSYDSNLGNGTNNKFWEDLRLNFKLKSIPAKTKKISLPFLNEAILKELNELPNLESIDYFPVIGFLEYQNRIIARDGLPEITPKPDALLNLESKLRNGSKSIQRLEKSFGQPLIPVLKDLISSLEQVPTGRLINIAARNSSSSESKPRWDRLTREYLSKRTYLRQLVDNPLNTFEAASMLILKADGSLDVQYLSEKELVNTNLESNPNWMYDVDGTIYVNFADYFYSFLPKEFLDSADEKLFRNHTHFGFELFGVNQKVIQNSPLVIENILIDSYSYRTLNLNDLTGIDTLRKISVPEELENEWIEYRNPSNCPVSSANEVINAECSRVLSGREFEPEQQQEIYIAPEKALPQSLDSNIPEFLHGHEISEINQFSSTNTIYFVMDQPERFMGLYLDKKIIELKKQCSKSTDSFFLFANRFMNQEKPEYFYCEAGADSRLQVKELPNAVLQKLESIRLQKDYAPFEKYGTPLVHKDYFEAIITYAMGKYTTVKIGDDWGPIFKAEPVIHILGHGSPNYVALGIPLGFIDARDEVQKLVSERYKKEIHGLWDQISSHLSSSASNYLERDISIMEMFDFELDTAEFAHFVENFSLYASVLSLDAETDRVIGLGQAEFQLAIRNARQAISDTLMEFVINNQNQETFSQGDWTEISAVQSWPDRLMKHIDGENYQNILYLNRMKVNSRIVVIFESCASGEILNETSSAYEDGLIMFTTDHRVVLRLFNSYFIDFTKSPIEYATQYQVYPKGNNETNLLFLVDRFKSVYTSHFDDLYTKEDFDLMIERLKRQLQDE